MPNLNQLSKKDRKRERLKIKLNKQTLACEDNQCGNKVQHADFWSAMQHCDQLCKLTGILYSIYCCETCGFAHVGHTAAPSITWMMEGYSEIVQTKLH
jgi:hypothetical protein